MYICTVTHSFACAVAPLSLTRSTQPSLVEFPMIFAFCVCIVQVRDYNSKAPLQGNVYPLVHKVAIGDEDVEMFVATQRPMGVMGPDEGALEMNLHRFLISVCHNAMLCEELRHILVVLEDKLLYEENLSLLFTF